MAVIDTVHLVHLVLAHAVIKHLVVVVQHYDHLIICCQRILSLLHSSYLKRSAVRVDLSKVDQVAVVDGHILNLLSIHPLLQLDVSEKIQLMSL